MSAKSRVAQRTAYPHIVKIDGVCGGQAVIEGTRIAGSLIRQFADSPIR